MTLFYAFLAEVFGFAAHEMCGWEDGCRVQFSMKTSTRDEEMKGYIRKRNRPFPVSTRVRVKLRRRVSVFKKHSHMMSWLGAIILLGTFVVKDALRENLKDLVDKLDAAENLYTIRREIGLLRDDLTPSVNPLEAEVTTKKVTYSEKENEAAFRKLQLNLEDESKIDRQALMNCIDLTQSFRIDANVLHEEMGILHSIDSMIYKIEELKGSYSDEDALRGAPIFVARQYSPAVQRDAEDDYDRLGKVEEHESVVIREALDLADAKKKSREFGYALCTWTSYVLYAAGWGLALIGQSFGVEVFSEKAD